MNVARARAQSNKAPNVATIVRASKVQLTANTVEGVLAAEARNDFELRPWFSSFHSFTLLLLSVLVSDP